jgi:hypothetical protein
MPLSLRDRNKQQISDTDTRAASLRANSLYTVGTVIQGGERHLIDTGSGIYASSNFGGAVAVGGVVLARQDSGQSFFYSNG